MDKQRESQRTPRFTVDSFCDEIAKSFSQGLKRGFRYSGLYVYSSDGLTQQDLNEFRDKILTRLESSIQGTTVIASICSPDNLQSYDVRFPGVEGWLIVDAGYFVKSGNLVT
ncbi:MAG: hypothetical protein WC796_01595 [Candidatus Pacearchaeota archaeon]|jgi:hypothetical protein